MTIRNRRCLALILFGCVLAVAIGGCRKVGKTPPATTQTSVPAPAPTTASTAGTTLEGVSVWLAVAAPAIIAPTPPVPHTDWRAAVFVRNRTDLPEKKVAVLEDLLTGRIAKKGFALVSPEDATKAVSGKETAMDVQLADNTAALRLAQNLDVDFLFIPSIVTFGHEETAYDGNGIKTVTTQYKLRISYKILDATVGAARDGDTVEVSKSVRKTSDLTVTGNTVIDDLLDEAAVKLVAGVTKPAGLPPPTCAPLTVTCGVAGLTVPDIVKTNGAYMVTDTKFPIQATNVTVELDGVVIGTAPGTFNVAKGLHKMRLSREGFNNWDRTVTAADGLKLNVDLTMSEEQWKRLQSQASFLQSLKTNEKLTDAGFDTAEGFATLLRNSRMVLDIQHKSDVDIKSDLKGMVQPALFAK